MLFFKNLQTVVEGSAVIYTNNLHKRLHVTRRIGVAGEISRGGENTAELELEG